MEKINLSTSDLIATVALVLALASFFRSRKQVIESNIFQMFDTFRKIIDSMGSTWLIDNTNKEEILKGQMYMSKLAEAFRINIRGKKNKSAIPSESAIFVNHSYDEKIENLDVILEKYYDAYDGMYFEDGKVLSKAHYSNLGHYFRYFYNILKYVNKKFLLNKTKRFYIDLLQAQMSNDELFFIFYNSLSKYGKYDNGKGKLYNWLEKFSFLQNINKHSLIKETHIKYYPKTTFKFSEIEKKKSWIIKYIKPWNDKMGFQNFSIWFMKIKSGFTIYKDWAYKFLFPEC